MSWSPLRLALLTLSTCALSSALNLTEVLSSTPELSTLYTILRMNPTMLDSLNAQGATLLAPTNEALNITIRAQGGASNLTPEIIQNLISYHTLPGTLNSANLTVAGGTVAETGLVNETLSNLQGSPNVVYASAFGSTGLESAQGQLKIYSGVGEEANVTRPDLNFDGGVVHVIDHVLNFPRPCTETAEEAALTTLISAFRTGKLWQTVDQTPKFTCFAPTNEAFQASGIDLESLSPGEVENLLKYHSIVGEVGYSTSLEDGKEYQTMLGAPVTVRKRDGELFINDVAVQTGNIIMSNGVAHILSGVLIPPADATSGGSGTGTTTGTGTGTAAGASTSTAGGAESANTNSAKVAGLLGAGNSLRLSMLLSLTAMVVAIRF